MGSRLEDRCRKEGLSHATIGDIIKGSRDCPETIGKLAQAFSQSGSHHRFALENKLLVLAGYRSERPAGKEPSEFMARLMDKVSEFNEPELKIMARFCDFIREMEKK